MNCMLRTWNTDANTMKFMKHFGEGWLKEAGAVQKNLQLHNVNMASYYTEVVVGWRSCLTQCRIVTEVKHGRARSGVGWVTAQVIDQ